MRSGFLLLLAIAAVFWPALGGSWVLDDMVLVADNAALQNDDFARMLTQPLFGIANGYWRPFSTLLLWIGHDLAGPIVIHLLALSLHAANTLTVQMLAHRLLGEPSRAFWVALLFAVHPVQVESVAWCSAINDPLWTACTLQCTMAALRWRDRGAAGVPWVATAWSFAALLAKESGVISLPLVIAALVWVPPTPGRSSHGIPWTRLVLAFSVACLLWLAMRAIALGEQVGEVLLAADVKAIQPLRLLTAPFDLLLRHLALLLYPFPITPFRTLPAQVSAVRAAELLVGTAMVLTALACCWRWLPRSARFAWTVLLVPLLPPLLCFRGIGSYSIADRYLYLTVAGFAMLVAHVAGRERVRWLSLCMVLVCAPVSFVQTWIWHSHEGFVERAVTLHHGDPNLAVMAGDLALVKAQTGSIPAMHSARSHYSAAVAGVVVPEHGEAPCSLSAALLGLAWCNLLEQQGRRGPDTPALVVAFRRAVDAGPENPAAWVGLGVANAIAERYGEAECALRHALALDRGHSEAWFNLGLLQVRTNRKKEAIASLHQAVTCKPGNMAARRLLGQIETPPGSQSGASTPECR